MQISAAIPKKHTYASLGKSKTKNGRAMNFVSIDMFSWSRSTMNRKITFQYLLQKKTIEILYILWNSANVYSVYFTCNDKLP